MTKDKIFAETRESVRPFRFDEEVAQCFDDMILRSVPLYAEMQQLTFDLVEKFLPPAGKLIDLGCSTGNTLWSLVPLLESKKSKAIGVELSRSMLDLCVQRFSALARNPVDFIQSDILDFSFPPASLYVAHYTLQFLPVDRRKEIVQKVAQALPQGGLFLVSEKIHFEEAHLQDIAEQGYYRMKRRNGYSEVEIAQKRDALKNVLMTLSPRENREMFADAGFSRVEVLQSQYLFVTYLVKK